MKKLILASLMMFGGLLATHDDHECDSRVMSQAERILAAQEREAEGQIVQQIVDSPYLLNYRSIAPLFPYSNHKVADYTQTFDIIELEDQSRWTIDPADRYLISTWRVGDSLTITRNHDWFGPCYFRLNNKVTGVSIRVNFSLPPETSNPHTYWITAVDYYNHQIYLNNGTLWTIYGSDWDIVKNWRAFDTIVIGVNDSNTSVTRPNILINCISFSSLDARWEY